MPHFPVPLGARGGGPALLAATGPAPPAISAVVRRPPGSGRRPPGGAPGWCAWLHGPDGSSGREPGGAEHPGGIPATPEVRERLKPAVQEARGVPAVRAERPPLSMPGAQHFDLEITPLLHAGDCQVDLSPWPFRHHSRRRLSPAADRRSGGLSTFCPLLAKPFTGGPAARSSQHLVQRGDEPIVGSRRRRPLRPRNSGIDVSGSGGLLLDRRALPGGLGEILAAWQPDIGEPCSRGMPHAPWAESLYTFV